MRELLVYMLHFVRRYLMMCVFASTFSYAFLNANIPILPGANNVQLGGVAVGAVVMYWIYHEISQAFWEDPFPDEKPAGTPEMPAP